MSSPRVPTQTQRDGTAAGQTAPPVNPYAEIFNLARGTSSRSRYLGQVLRYVTGFFGSPYAAIHVRFAAEVVQDDFHTGPADPKFWRSMLQDFLTDSLSEPGPRAKVLRSRTGDTKVALIAAPISDAGGAGVGAIALVIAPIDEAALPARLASLEAMARLASACMEQLGTAPPPASPSSRPGPAISEAGAKALGHAAGFESAEELAFSITNELRSKLGCEQVALGLVRGRRVRVLSISGLDQVSRKSPGVQSLTAAMEECLDAAEPIAYPRGTDWSRQGVASEYRIHRQWHAAAKGDAVASIPLRAGESVVAVLGLRDRPDRPFADEKIATIRSRVEPFAPALLLASKAGRGVTRHMLDSGGAVVEALLRPQAVGRKVVAAVAAAAVLAFFFGTMPYNLTVPTVVTAAQVRHLASPFDGVLIDAPAVEGDYVRKGQVLCAFDRRDVEQQIAALSAELTVQEHEQDRAMSAASPVDVKLAAAKQELTRAKLAIAERRAERAVVRAPMDGLIVRGDLRKQVGGAIHQGQPLFEIAPIGEWLLELAVPEYAATELRSGLAGVYLSQARPEKATRFSVIRVRPKAEVRAARNVYIAEAAIDGRGDDLRPGMEGVARVGLGSRRVSWVVLHRAVDFLRLHFWL